MIFGEIATADAQGAILAHATKAGRTLIKKGTILSAEDVARLSEAGIASLIAARLEPGDVAEDEAARRIAKALLSAHVEAAEAATGRVNLFATAAGVLMPDRALIDAANAVDPAITIATLGAFASVAAGDMVATVKIIPLAVPGEALERVEAVLASVRREELGSGLSEKTNEDREPREADRFTTNQRDPEGAALSLAPFRAHRVHLVQTELPSTKPSVLDKTFAVTAARLAASGSTIVKESRVPHAAGPLAGALAAPGEADMTLVFGASAVIDRKDVVPSAIERAGGSVSTLGMPVDPGNLLLFGRLNGQPVFGAPGCARSPKENGFDWMLNRVLAGLDIDGPMIAGLGVGGLLMEIPSRPQPRGGAAKERRPVVDVLILAAGRSSRMTGGNKLLALFDGVPLVRRTAMTALGARSLGAVRIVTGHMRTEIEAALDGLDVEFVANPDFSEGLSTSLKAGFAASLDADGVLVLLADQPLVTSADLDRLVAAFLGREEGVIVAASDGGKRRNPVILPTLYASEIAALSGDIGAAPVIAAHGERVVEIEIGERASVDVDTIEMLTAAGGIFARP